MQKQLCFMLGVAKYKDFSKFWCSLFPPSSVSVLLCNLCEEALWIKLGGISEVFWRGSFRTDLSISHTTSVIQKAFGGDEWKKTKKKRWKLYFVCVPSVRTAEEENSHSGYTALIISSGLLVARQSQVVQRKTLLGIVIFSSLNSASPSGVL